MTITPPFDLDSARKKVQLAEDLWNTRNPEKVSLAYTDDSVWRNRAEFLEGRGEIVGFLTKKWQKELDYKLKKELWCFDGNRIAVRFEYEWHDNSGQWYRSHGNELWEFASSGLMQQRDASINDYTIREEERRIF
jgi:nuclear transport factor 2 (NTF2) superfamily protein